MLCKIVASSANCAQDTQQSKIPPRKQKLPWLRIALLAQWETACTEGKIRRQPRTHVWQRKSGQEQICILLDLGGVTNLDPRGDGKAICRAR